MPRSSSVVAVVGGGASGTLAAAHVLRTAPEAARVVVIEPRLRLGEGVAYGTIDPGHLFNVRAGALSGLGDAPDDFTQWARRHSPVDACSFVPRAWYGEYLRSVVGPVEHLHTRAVGIEPKAGRVRLELAQGPPLLADRVILAPGFPPPRWPFEWSTSDARWIVDPWVPGALSELRPADPVLLVGTGPTAVDVAVSLHTAGHRHILATSRHGLLPLVHPQVPFASLSLQPPLQSNARALLGWARAAAGQCGDWRPVIDALRPQADEVWGALSMAERARLLRLLVRRWEVVRHRMAPAVAQRVEIMRNEGSLTVTAGGVRSAHTKRSGLEITLGDRHVRVGAVINCTGLVPDVRRSSDQLIRRLLNQRLARPSALGLGLEADAEGCLPGTEDSLWLIGPLRRGELWETTAMPEIRTQATQLARSLWRVNAKMAPRRRMAPRWRS